MDHIGHTTMINTTYSWIWAQKELEKLALWIISNKENGCFTGWLHPENQMEQLIKVLKVGFPPYRLFSLCWQLYLGKNHLPFGDSIQSFLGVHSRTHLTVLQASVFVESVRSCAYIHFSCPTGMQLKEKYLKTPNAQKTMHNHMWNWIDAIVCSFVWLTEYSVMCRIDCYQIPKSRM